MAREIFYPSLLVNGLWSLEVKRNYRIFKACSILHMFFILFISRILPMFPGFSYGWYWFCWQILTNCLMYLGYSLPIPLTLLYFSFKLVQMIVSQESVSLFKCFAFLLTSAIFLKSIILSYSMALHLFQHPPYAPFYFGRGTRYNMLQAGSMSVLSLGTSINCSCWQQRWKGCGLISINRPLMKSCA